MNNLIPPREIVPWFDRVYNRKSARGFLSFEPFEFVIVHKSEGWAPPKGPSINDVADFWPF